MAGATAFVRYLIAAMNYGQVTLDSSVLDPLLAGACSVCRAPIDEIDKIASRAGTVHGGVITASNIRVAQMRKYPHAVFSATFTWHSSRQVITYRQGPSDLYPAGSETVRWTLSGADAGWQVIGWEFAS